MMDAMVEAYSTRFPAIQALELRMKVRVVEKLILKIKYCRLNKWKHSFNLLILFIRFQEAMRKL